MIKIKFVNGIPCIVLDLDGDGSCGKFTDIQRKKEELYMPEIITEIKRLKEMAKTG